MPVIGFTSEVGESGRVALGYHAGIRKILPSIRASAMEYVGSLNKPSWTRGPFVKPLAENAFVGEPTNKRG